MNLEPQANVHARTNPPQKAWWETVLAITEPVKLATEAAPEATRSPQSSENRSTQSVTKETDADIAHSLASLTTLAVASPPQALQRLEPHKTGQASSRDEELAAINRAWFSQRPILTNSQRANLLEVRSEMDAGPRGEENVSESKQSHEVANDADEQALLDLGLPLYFWRKHPRN